MVTSQEHHAPQTRMLPEPPGRGACAHLVRGRLARDFELEFAGHIPEPEGLVHVASERTTESKSDSRLAPAAEFDNSPGGARTHL